MTKDEKIHDIAVAMIRRHSMELTTAKHASFKRGED